MTKKYILTDNCISLYKGKKLYQIKCVQSFGCVREGDLGGFIEKEDNLSHDGDCWIYDEARVYDDAKVHDDALVFCRAEVHGCAEVFGEAQLCDKVNIYGNAKIYDRAKVSDYACVCDNASVYGDAQIYGCAKVHGNAEVYNEANVCDRSDVYGDAQIFGKACLFGGARIGGEGWISSDDDHCGLDLCLGNGHIHAYMTRYDTVEVTDEGFQGTLDEFVKYIKSKYNRINEKQYNAIVAIIMAKFNLD